MAGTTVVFASQKYPLVGVPGMWVAVPPQWGEKHPAIPKHSFCGTGPHSATIAAYLRGSRCVWRWMGQKGGGGD